MQNVILIEAPSETVLSLDEARLHLRIDSDDENLLITSMISAAVDQIDPASGGWLERALRPQTWELQLDSFIGHDCWNWRYPRHAIALPFPPLLEIVSIKYDDVAGAEQTLDPADYRVLGLGSKSKQAVVPVYGKGWPSARSDHAAIRIRYRCGHPSAVPAQGETLAIPDTLPAPIVAWVKLLVGSFYENRETFVATTGRRLEELPAHILNMLDIYRPIG